MKHIGITCNRCKIRDFTVKYDLFYRDFDTNKFLPNSKFYDISLAIDLALQNYLLEIYFRKNVIITFEYNSRDPEHAAMFVLLSIYVFRVFDRCQQLRHQVALKNLNAIWVKL